MAESSAIYDFRSEMASNLERQSMQHWILVHLARNYMPSSALRSVAGQSPPQSTLTAPELLQPKRLMHALVLDVGRVAKEGSPLFKCFVYLNDCGLKGKAKFLPAMNLVPGDRVMVKVKAIDSFRVTLEVVEKVSSAEAPPLPINQK